MSTSQPNSSGPDATSGAAATKPGDEAATGTPGTGEGVCRRCGGSGVDGGQRCPDCAGTGRVTVGIGGG